MYVCVCVCMCMCVCVCVYVCVCLYVQPTGYNRHVCAFRNLFNTELCCPSFISQQLTFVQSSTPNLDSEITIHVHMYTHTHI